MSSEVSPSVRSLTSEIRRLARDLGEEVKIMEVCGTHTVALRQTGVLSLLPENISLVSGPGCPVCVTPSGYIENARSLIEGHGAIVASFGDMLKVPAPGGRSLSSYLGSDRVRIVYSPSELIGIAEAAEDMVVFLGVGFETTAPAVASVFLRAAERDIRNLFLYGAFKLVPPALAALLDDEETDIDAFLLPGHVSAVIGLEPYGFIPETRGKPGAVAGFEGEEILSGIASLLGMLSTGSPGIRNAYAKVVRTDGNRKARKITADLLQPADALWRGFGLIPASGMVLREPYRRFDAAETFGLPELINTDSPRCLCGGIIQGKSRPTDCPLFGSICTPDRPEGPCMVSSEGTCAAYFQFGGMNL